MVTFPLQQNYNESLRYLGTLYIAKMLTYKVLSELKLTIKTRPVSTISKANDTIH